MRDFLMLAVVILIVNGLLILAVMWLASRCGWLPGVQFPWNKHRAP
jgi:hypothetical protein